MMKKSNNGFTLAELLVVVAIVAVLVAIAVPVFTSQLEKSREATDLANVRAAYAKILSSAISEDSSSEYYKSPGVFEAEVALVQTKDGWTTDVSNMSIGHVKSADWDKHDPLGNGSCKLTYANGKMNIDWGGENPTPSSVSVDYSVPYNVGSYVISELSSEISAIKNNEKTNAELNKAISGNNRTYQSTMKLPNGKTINTVVYSRDYGDFDTINARLTENTASLIYDTKTSELSTIIYYDGKNVSVWQASSNKGWDDPSAWSDNTYVQKNGTKYVYRNGAFYISNN